jgi:hypothetical protein
VVHGDGSRRRFRTMVQDEGSGRRFRTKVQDRFKSGGVLIG